jgi:hypothetical protein
MITEIEKDYMGGKFRAHGVHKSKCNIFIERCHGRSSAVKHRLRG